MQPLLHFSATHEIEMLLGILDTLHEGVVVMAPESTIIYANPAYARILGVPVQKVLRKKCYEIEPAAGCLRALKTRQPIVGEYEVVKSVGVHIIFDTSCLYHNGKFVGICSVFRDISEIVKLNQKLAELKKQLNHYGRSSLPEAFAPLIGQEPQFVQKLNLAAQVAPADVTVLIQGETGVGKELLARAIHQASRRQAGPFIAVNCAALPEALFESELFGYAGGAFTGAKSGGKLGKFHLAHNGTLFLDEIGELPLAMQAKLLRVLQEHEVDRIGASRPEPVDVRVIAATNTDLKAMVAAGSFRQDLYWRVNVIPIRLPGLREHPQDIPLIAQAYLDEINRTTGQKFSFHQEVLNLFTRYTWPGNVRELQNAIRHASLVASGPVITVADLPSYLAQELPKKSPALEGTHEQLPYPLKLYLAGAEKEALQEALRLTKNNRSQAMRVLGVSRRTFYKKLKKYDML